MKLSKQTKYEVNRLITVREAAAQLGVSVCSVHNFIRRHQLPVLGLRGALLLDPDDVAGLAGVRRGRPRKKAVE